ncbi:hypothetical protein CDD83_925 [Cordyceps sp. RAO-2017]|nr:hypothetical protein CDD83_925 [Cordyceps sp. RAO-2017]
MLPLWSRAGQIHRCGCRACNVALRAAGRRAMTASRRRKPSFVDVFTACYSSVFATVAIFDSARKESRKRDLDRQLDEARRELSDLREMASLSAAQHEVRDEVGDEVGDDAKDEADPGSPRMTVDQMATVWAQIRTMYRTRPFMKEIHRPAVARACDLVLSLKREHYGCPDESVLRDTAKTDYSYLERMVMAEETDDSIISRDAKNQVQLSHELNNTTHIVRNLLRRAATLDTAPGPSPNFDEAQELLETGQPEFTFRDVDPDRAEQNTVLINRVLRAVLGTPDLRLKEKIGRICYNILVSPYAPDMHSYNTLIVAFDKLGMHAFSDIFVWSFFQERLLRPTPSTYVAILNHFKVTHNHGRFLGVLACLSGSDGNTGGKIRRRHIVQIASSKRLRNWASDTRVRTLTGRWVWEHVPLTTDLIEEVIAGLLYFRLFQQAASFFLTCIQSGISLSTKAAKHVLDGCAVALDWSGALELIRGLANSERRWRAMLLTGDESTNWYLINRIYTLLDLCGLGGSGQQVTEAYLDNLGISGPELCQLLVDLEGQEAGLKQPCFPEMVRDVGDTAGPKSRLLRIESIWKEYVRVRKTTRSIESKLLYPWFPMEFRVAMAQHIGHAAIRGSTQLSQELKGLLANGSGAFGGWVPELASSSCRRADEQQQAAPRGREGAG